MDNFSSDDDLDQMFNADGGTRRSSGLFDDLAKEFDVESSGIKPHSPYAPPPDAKHETLVEDSNPNQSGGLTLAHTPPAKADDTHATIYDAHELVKGVCQFCRADVQHFKEIHYCSACQTPLVPGANFCYHCGKSQQPAPSLTLHLVSSGETYTLVGDREEYSVGRTVPQQNNFVDIDLGPLGQRKISRQHARFLVKDQEWFLEDQNSKGGTFVFNQQLKANTPMLLEDGMVIYFSDIQFKIEIS